MVAKANNLRVGKNIVINRLSVLNRKISLEWLKLLYGAFKKRIKELFCESAIILNSYHEVPTTNLY